MFGYSPSSIGKQVGNDAILYNAQNGLATWRGAKALQDAYLAGNVANPGIININFLGDSITAGYAGTELTIALIEKGYVGLVKKAIQAKYSDTGKGFMGLGVPYSAASPMVWTTSGTFQNYGVPAWNFCHSTDRTLKFSNGLAGNTYTVNFDGSNQFNGTGIVLLVGGSSVAGAKIKINIDGGGDVEYPYTSADKVFAIAITGLVAGNHTLVITTEAVPFNFFGGYEIKGDSGVRVNNMGYVGGVVANSSRYDATTYVATYTAQINYWQPKLTIISYLFNNYNQSISLTSYIEDYQRLITQAKLTGDVLLTSIGGIANRLDTPSMQDYKDALYNLAMQNNCAYLDTSKRWGNAYATAYGAGFMLNDGAHPTVAGQQDLANVILETLEI